MTGMYCIATGVLVVLFVLACMASVRGWGLASPGHVQTVTVRANGYNGSGGGVNSFYHGYSSGGRMSGGK